jgi:hypothetical protein
MASSSRTLSFAGRRLQGFARYDKDLTGLVHRMFPSTRVHFREYVANRDMNPVFLQTVPL